ncbi:MAG: hypothetical protein AAF821_27320 [Cyanobacteria bacterium P01_D01_bin.156]
MPTENYDSFLLEELRDTETAAEYLSASIESGLIDEFLVALRNVASAYRSLGLPGCLTHLLKHL